MTDNSLSLLNNTAYTWLGVMWRASWQGGLVILLVWLVCKLAPRLPANVRAMLWWLACLKLIAGLMSPIVLPVLPAAPAAPIEVSPGLENSSVQIPEIASSIQVAPSKLAHEVHSSHANDPSVSALFFVGWLILACALLVVTAARSFRVLLIRHTAYEARPAFQRMAAAIAASMRVKYVPRVLISLRLKAPVAAGMLRPAILLPEAAEQNLSNPEIQMILTHEMAHIKRGDLVLSLLPSFARTLFFFHPLAWLAAREFAIAREEACDAETLRLTQQHPRNYGRLLLKILDSGRQPESAVALGVATNHRHIERRLKMLRNTNGSSSTGRSRIMVAGVVISAAFWVLPWKLTAQERQPGKAEAPAQTPAVPAEVSESKASTPASLPDPRTSRESGLTIDPRSVPSVRSELPALPEGQPLSIPSTSPQSKQTQEPVGKRVTTPGSSPLGVQWGSAPKSDPRALRGSTPLGVQWGSAPKSDPRALPGSAPLGVQWASAPKAAGKATPGSTPTGTQWLSAPNASGKQFPGASAPTLWRYPAKPGETPTPNIDMDYVVSNDFGSTTAYEVVRYVFDTAGASYRIDEDVERVARETKLTLSANNVPLRRVLEMALAASRSRSKPLTYHFDSGFYVISFLEANVPGGIPEKPKSPGRNRSNANPAGDRAPGTSKPTPVSPRKDDTINLYTPAKPDRITQLEIGEAEEDYRKYSSQKREVESQYEAALLVYSVSHPRIAELKASVADTNRRLQESRATLVRLTSSTK